MIVICPVCKRKTTWEENPSRPFCSERCKFIDFDKWMTEEYTVPGEEQRAEKHDNKDTKEDMP